MWFMIDLVENEQLFPKIYIYNVNFVIDIWVERKLDKKTEKPETFVYKDGAEVWVWLLKLT